MGIHLEHNPCYGHWMYPTIHFPMQSSFHQGRKLVRSIHQRKFQSVSFLALLNQAQRTYVQWMSRHRGSSRLVLILSWNPMYKSWSTLIPRVFDLSFPLSKRTMIRALSFLLVHAVLAWYNRLPVDILKSFRTMGSCFRKPEQVLSILTNWSQSHHLERLSGCYVLCSLSGTDWCTGWITCSIGSTSSWIPYHFVPKMWESRRR